MSAGWELLFVSAGVGLVVSGIVSAVRNRRYLARGVRVPGEVVDLRRSKGADRDDPPTWRPVFRFQTYEGRDVEVVSSLSRSSPAVRRGEQVTVIYASDDPDRARLDKFGERGFFSGWFLLVVGVFLTAVGVASVF